MSDFILLQNLAKLSPKIVFIPYWGRISMGVRMTSEAQSMRRSPQPPSQACGSCKIKGWRRILGYCQKIIIFKIIYHDQMHCVEIANKFINKVVYIYYGIQSIWSGKAGQIAKLCNSLQQVNKYETCGNYLSGNYSNLFIKLFCPS